MRDLRIFRIFEGTNDILRLFVALTGIQYAGGHLKELQKAVRDPISNFGVVLGEVTKRGRSAMGLGAGNVLANNVRGRSAKRGVKRNDRCCCSRSTQICRPRPARSAAWSSSSATPSRRCSSSTVRRSLVQVVDIPRTLTFSGKHIINEQFLLKRIADSAIDIYAMVSMLSRCSQSLNAGVTSAMHEEVITKVTTAREWTIYATAFYTVPFLSVRIDFLQRSLHARDPEPELGARESAARQLPQHVRHFPERVRKRPTGTTQPTGGVNKENEEGSAVDALYYTLEWTLIKSTSTRRNKLVLRS